MIALKNGLLLFPAGAHRSEEIPTKTKLSVAFPQHKSMIILHLRARAMVD